MATEGLAGGGGGGEGGSARQPHPPSALEPEKYPQTLLTCTDKSFHGYSLKIRQLTSPDHKPALPPQGGGQLPRPVGITNAHPIIPIHEVASPSQRPAPSCARCHPPAPQEATSDSPCLAEEAEPQRAEAFAQVHRVRKPPSQGWYLERSSKPLPFSVSES